MIDCTHLVGLIVEEDGVDVGEDEEVPIGHEVHERVEVGGPFCQRQESEWDGPLSAGGFGDELIVGLVDAPNDNDPAVRQDLVCAVPPLDKEASGGALHPVIGGSCADAPEDFGALIVTAGLLQCAVRQEGAGGAERVGEEEQRANGIGEGVILHRVCGAVVLEIEFLGVVAARAIGEGDLRLPEVGSVVEDHLVCVHGCHVHRGYACILNHHLPRIQRLGNYWGTKATDDCDGQEYRRPTV